MSEVKPVSVIVDEEKGKSTSEVTTNEKGTGNNCLMTFGAIGGVIMAVGIGLLTSVVVKSQNENQALEEEMAKLREQYPELETETPIAPGTSTAQLHEQTSTSELLEQIKQLKISKNQILDQVDAIIKADHAHHLTDYSPETYPRFSADQKDDTIKKWDLRTFLVWESIPKFQYSDARFECYDCEYSAVKVLGDGSIYLGQWKDGQLNGRGTIMNGESTLIKEGYFQDGIFIGKRRQIDDKGVVREWNIENESSDMEFTCSRKYMKCKPKEVSP